MPEIESKLVYSEENDAAVYNYLRYIVSPEAEGGGQSKLLEEKHYAKLPANVEESAELGMGLDSEEADKEAVEWPEEQQEKTGGPNMGPVRIASLGDSFISGEAGRWAGNTNSRLRRIDALGRRAYNDGPGRAAELISRCHRSASAEIYIGTVPGNNLACSGAKTVSFKEGNYLKPGLDTGIVGVTGQTKMLETYAATNNVKMVVVSIGGNNFNFGTIVARCVIDFMTSRVNNPRFCQNDAAATVNITPAAIAARRTEIREGLERVKTAMTAAGYNANMYTVVVQNYESTIPEGGPGREGFRYPQNGQTRQSVGGCGFWNNDANWANRTVLPAINNAVRTAALGAGLPNLKLLNLREAFEGRRLCENGLVQLSGTSGIPKWDVAGAVNSTEWVNMIRTLKEVPILRRFYRPQVLAQESLHPNYWAQLALRNCLRQVYNNGVPVEGACKRGVNGLNANREPNMTLHRPVRMMSAGAGSAQGKATFTLGKATIKCEEATFSWKATGEAPSLELTPAYEKCTAADATSEVAAKVAVKGCTYTLNEAEGGEVLQAWMALSSGCVIELAATFASECKMKIEGSQEVEMAKIIDLNKTAGAFESEIDPEAMALVFTSTGKGCEEAGVPEEGLGTYEGKTVAKGIVAEEPSVAFQAKGQLKGSVKIVKSGEFLDEGSTVKCPEKEIEAMWSVQSRGVVNEHEKEGKQLQVKGGPNLNVNIKWGFSCVATIGGTKFSAKVKPCELQARSQPGQLKATGGVVTACVIEVPGVCIVTMTEGKETKPESNEGANVGLKETKLENKGDNLLAGSNITGVTTEVKNLGLCPLKNNKTAELKSVEMEAVGVNSV